MRSKRLYLSLRAIILRGIDKLHMEERFTNEELCLLIQQGRTDLIYQLWLQVEKFIRSLAEQYVNQNEQDPELIDDICQESYIALHKLVMNYRTDKNALFLTYLKAAIRTTIRSVIFSGRGTAKEKDPLNNYTSLNKVLIENPDGSIVELQDVLPDEASEDGLREVENDSYRQSQNAFLRECIELATDKAGKEILLEMLASNCGYRDAILNLYGPDALADENTVVKLRRKKDFAVTQIRRKSRKQKAKLMEKYSLLEDNAERHGLQPYSLKSYKEHEYTSGVERTILNIERYNSR